MDKYTIRFWDKVRKTENCWLWFGAKDVQGYGYMVLQRSPRKTIKAHRLSYKLYFGDFRAELCVCHTCDNPSCVNPEHLFLGTRLDNNRDKIIKGRQPHHRGESNPRAKITWEQRNAIKILINSGKTQTQVARSFGLSQPQISRIVSGENWLN